MPRDALLELTLTQPLQITAPLSLCVNTALPRSEDFSQCLAYLFSPQDLFSALIKGPTRTPYEDGLFLFDIQLPNIYPAVPPLFRYLSQCSGRLNPNLYDNGKVCVSLLGTWIGKVTLASARPWGAVAVPGCLGNKALPTRPRVPGGFWALVVLELGIALALGSVFRH